MWRCGQRRGFSAPQALQTPEFLLALRARRGNSYSRHRRSTTGLFVPPEMSRGGGRRACEAAGGTRLVGRRRQGLAPVPVAVAGVLVEPRQRGFAAGASVQEIARPIQARRPRSRNQKLSDEGRLEGVGRADRRMLAAYADPIRSLAEADGEKLEAQELRILIPVRHLIGKERHSVSGNRAIASEPS